MILTPKLTEKIGGSILIILGLWALFQFFRSPEEKIESIVSMKEKILLRFELKTMGIVIQILKKPMTADLDKSGTITGFEAVLLGAALSLDAVGAGFGASMLGYSPILLSIAVGFMSAIFATIGILFGSSFGKNQWIKQFSFIPGLLLILVGIWKI